MLHEPAVEIGADYASKKKTRLGIILFFVYAAIYAAFVYIGLVQTDLLGEKALGNVNLAIVYGLGLIILAGVMGFVYNIACSRMEDKLKGGLKR
ncbi:MAG: DUF485 domain-containing protein [Tenuifilaceae bacterium]|jgi:uncharacterized membrane protein (DUF485 family)|nr:DUF485 domain-containing protein [Tenuifilaceae bacterium]